jgi:hypothetical protein
MCYLDHLQATAPTDYLPTYFFLRFFLRFSGLILDSILMVFLSFSCRETAKNATKNRMKKPTGKKSVFPQLFRAMRPSHPTKKRNQGGWSQKSNPRKHATRVGGQTPPHWSSTPGRGKKMQPSASASRQCIRRASRRLLGRAAQLDEHALLATCGITNVKRVDAPHCIYAPKFAAAKF